MSTKHTWICEQRVVSVTTYIVEAATRTEALRLLSTQPTDPCCVGNEVRSAGPIRVIRKDLPAAPPIAGETNHAHK